MLDIQWCSLFISIFWSNKYLTSCNVWLISLKFISHNNLEWIQTSLDFKWFKCMIIVKPYTVWLDRLCWIKVLHVWILMSDGYVYSILDTIPNYGRKRSPARTHFYLYALIHQYIMRTYGSFFCERVHNCAYEFLILKIFNCKET